LENELAQDVTFDIELRAAIEARELPTTYFEHPIVTGAPPGSEPVVPVGMFVDGVPFAKKDSVIGFWFYTLTTGIRHIVAVIRKTQLCHCGCRGWCTLWVVFDWLRHGLVAMAQAIFPPAPYSGEAPWMPGLPAAALAGTAMRRYALCEIKADWAEVHTTFGMASWKSVLFPCRECCVERGEMSQITMSCATALPHATTTASDYEGACQAAEVWVTLIDAAQRSRLRGALGRKKYGGRVLLVVLPDLPLEVGDRLDPTPELPDIFGLHRVTVFPFRLRFWRRRNEP